METSARFWFANQARVHRSQTLIGFRIAIRTRVYRCRLQFAFDLPARRESVAVETMEATRPTAKPSGVPIGTARHFESWSAQADQYAGLKPYRSPSVTDSDMLSNCKAGESLSVIDSDALSICKVCESLPVTDSGALLICRPGGSSSIIDSDTLPLCKVCESRRAGIFPDTCRC